MKKVIKGQYYASLLDRLNTEIKAKNLGKKEGPVPPGQWTSTEIS